MPPGRRTFLMVKHLSVRAKVKKNTGRPSTGGDAWPFVHCISRACSVFRACRGSENFHVSVTPKITARESKKRAMQHSPTVLPRSLWPGGCFSSIKNPARKNSNAGCGRNRVEISVLSSIHGKMLGKIVQSSISTF